MYQSPNIEHVLGGYQQFIKNEMITAFANRPRATFWTNSRNYEIKWPAGETPTLNPSPSDSDATLSVIYIDIPETDEDNSNSDDSDDNVWDY